MLTFLAAYYVAEARVLLAAREMRVGYVTVWRYAVVWLLSRGRGWGPARAAMDGDSLPVDGIVGEFQTYEDYLDSQISATDLYYLEDEDLARQLVELGYRGRGETLKRDEFEARKKAAEVARINKLRAAPKALASANKDVTGYAFLASLA